MRNCTERSNKINIFELLNKFLIFFLAIAVWLQMWGIPIGKSGISISTIALILILVLNIMKIRFSLSSLVIAGFLIVFMIVVSLLNDNLPYEIWIFRVCRYTMLIMLVIMCNWIFAQKQYIDYFWNKLYLIVFWGGIYGIYQFLAPQYGLPYFLNIFSSNPTFGEHDLYRYYGGWIEYPRIYGVFSEPSFYGGFLALFSIIVLYSQKHSSLGKGIFLLLLSINLILTFSRVGYFVFGSILISYFLFKHFNLKLRRIALYFVGFLIISIPLLMPLIMHFLYQNEYYIDKSASGRTISQIYYFQQAIENVRFIGYGAGSIKSMSDTIASSGDIEGVAHNGLAQLSYELGLLSIVFYYFLMLRLLKSSSNPRYILMVVTGIACLISFGEFYSAESILILICALIRSDSQKEILFEAKKCG